MTTRARAEYEVGLRDTTGAAMASIRRNIARTSKIIGGLAVATAGVGFTRLVNDQRKFADEIQKIAIRLKGSTEALSQYRLLADRSGVSFGLFTDSLQKMNKRIAEGLVGQGKAGDAIARLGIDIEKLNKLSPEQQFEVLAEGFNLLDEGANKVQLASDIFGISGAKMIQAMEGGAKAIRQTREDADRFGLTIGRDMADSIATANDRLGDLSAIARGTANTFLIQFAPTLESVATFMANALPRSIVIAREAIDQMRIGLVSFAGDVAGFLGFEEAKNNLADLSSVYIEEFERMRRETDRFKFDAKGVVKFEDIVDESIRKNAITKQAEEIKKAKDDLLSDSKGGVFAKAIEQLQIFKKDLEFIRDDVLGGVDNKSSRIQGEFRSVNLARFSVDSSSGGKVQRVEDPQLKRVVKAVEDVGKVIVGLKLEALAS